MTVQQLLVSMHAVSISHEMHVTLTKAHLLAEIEKVGRVAAEHLDATSASTTVNIAFPRGKARFPWRGKKMRIWRLDLRHPLWLGHDGLIYRGYDVDSLDEEEFPQYLLRAEIDLRGVKGLQRVLAAVRALGPQPE